MTVDEARIIVNELKGRFDTAFSSIDKERIEVLYWEVLGKEFKPTTCQQCYHDALIEIYLYLKRENKMKEKSNFRLRAGFIINCPGFDGGKIYTNDNMADDVAKRYLKAFPKNVDMFQQLPKDFKVNSSKNGGSGDKSAKVDNSKAKGKNSEETARDGQQDA